MVFCLWFIDVRNVYFHVVLRRRERLGISYYVWSARAVDAMAPVVEALAGR